jgi:hypothetical protein
VRCAEFLSRYKAAHEAWNVGRPDPAGATGAEKHCRRYLDSLG